MRSFETYTTDMHRPGPTDSRMDEDTPYDDRSTDQQLFEWFLDGDDLALMELFDRHTHRLYLFARKFVPGRQAAEDLVQDVWERVIRLRQKGSDAPKQPLALLYTITRNLCLNHVRDRKKLSSLEVLPEWEHPRSHVPEMTQQEELVIVALDRLPLEQREILVLHAYAGYRYEEIAEMLGVGIGTVRTRAWRARAQLGRVITALSELDGGDLPSDDDADVNERRPDDDTSNTEE